MAIRWWLKELAILIVMYKITIAEGDLLESFRPRESNPPEVNEFLMNVLEHRDDFNLVRKVASTYQKKNTPNVGGFQPHSQYRSFYNDFDDIYGTGLKRNAPFVHRVRHKHKKRKEKKYRYGRDLPVDIFSGVEGAKEIRPYPKKPRTNPAPKYFVKPKGTRTKRQMYEKVLVEPEGEKGRIQQYLKIKKSAEDPKSPGVHRTYKENKAKKFLKFKKAQGNGDFYYVDLGEKVENEMEKRNNHQPRYSRPRYYYRAGNRPILQQPKEKFEYPVYETEPLHHSLNDEVAFEKALSYEIEPRSDDFANHNNPDGNNLYSVDEGRPDNVQLLNVQKGYSQGGVMSGEQTKDTTDENFFIDINNNLRKSDNNRMQATTNTTVPVASTSSIPKSSQVTEASGTKLIKQVGEGFIEITKGQKEVEDPLSNASKEPIVIPESNNGHNNIVPGNFVDGISKNNEQAPVFLNTVQKKNVINEENEDDSYIDSVDKREDKPVLLTESYSNIDEPVNVDSGESLVQVKNNENEKTNILSKNSLHPLRMRDTDVDQNEENFRSRKLQFIDERMMNPENEENEYEDMPKRPRRDFLDALGMKNEEDYSEDNAYKKLLTDNNTDIRNDTFMINSSTTECLPNSTITKANTDHILKHDMNTIKEILQEPKEVTEPTVMANFKTEKTKKRSKQGNLKVSVLKKLLKNKQRHTRHIPYLETKILQNKDRIYNYRGDRSDTKLNYNYYRPIKRGLRPKPWLENRHTLKFNRNIKKSIDFDDDLDKRYDFDDTNLLTTTSLSFDNDTDNFESTSGATGESTSEPSSTAIDEATINSKYEQLAQQMDLENENMAEVVNGKLASRIVSSVFDQMKDRAPLKSKFSPGLSRNHMNYAGTIDFDIFKANESEEVGEAQLFLEQLTKVLNKLVLNQVRRKMCQRLPDQLKQFLENTVNIKTNLPANCFKPNTKQGDYLFNYEEKKPEPPFDAKKLQGILLELETLLLSYHNLNPESQNRVEVVKDYIEKHVKMLKRIIDYPDEKCEAKTMKRNTKYDQETIQKELDSLGLGGSREYVPNFDVDEMVKNKVQNPTWNSYKKRDTKTKNSRRSAKYKKLAMAAEKVREKREHERKIAELFGGKQKRSVKKSNIDYEKPIVYSL